MRLLSPFPRAAGLAPGGLARPARVACASGVLALPLLLAAPASLAAGCGPSGGAATQAPDERTYLCPMRCVKPGESRPYSQRGPGECPVCGMALEVATPAEVQELEGIRTPVPAADPHADPHGHGHAPPTTPPPSAPPPPSGAAPPASSGADPHAGHGH